ncbi:RidA family protein [bacterium]|nr:RidA family protein [bacterium]
MLFYAPQIPISVKRILLSPQAPAPIGPYSQAVQVGSMVFLSGQIALNPENGKLITGDIRIETRMVLENLGAVLKAAGLGFSDVVKCSIFLADMGHFPAVNEVYAAYFPTEPPARETVEVKALPKNANIEISAIAAIG